MGSKLEKESAEVLESVVGVGAKSVCSIHCPSNESIKDTGRMGRTRRQV